MLTLKTRLISPDKSYAFSNLFVLVMTQSLMIGKISVISNGPDLSTDGSGVLFNSEQGSIVPLHWLDMTELPLHWLDMTESV